MLVVWEDQSTTLVISLLCASHMLSKTVDRILSSILLLVFCVSPFSSYNWCRVLPKFMVSVRRSLTSDEKMQNHCPPLLEPMGTAKVSLSSDASSVHCDAVYYSK